MIVLIVVYLPTPMPGLTIYITLSWGRAQMILLKQLQISNILMKCSHKKKSTLFKFNEKLNLVKRRLKMCNMNCENCYYTEINPKDCAGHCYMFRHEPNGDCSQFKLSEAAKISINQILDEVDKGQVNEL